MRWDADGEGQDADGVSCSTGPIRPASMLPYWRDYLEVTLTGQNGMYVSSYLGSLYRRGMQVAGCCGKGLMSIDIFRTI